MLVLDTCLAHGIPVACYVGGGYDKDLEILAARHTMLHEAAQECFEGYALGAMVSHDSLPFIPMPIASMDDIPGWDSCDKYGRIEGT